MIIFRCFGIRERLRINNSFVCPIAKGHSLLCANRWLLWSPEARSDLS
jgi:hypothetical protein